MLEHLDPAKKLRRREWEALREPLHRRLRALQLAACRAGMPILLIFEGWDAAGKGACIAAVTEALDRDGIRVWPIRAARGHELDYPWLWRFWMKLPARGRIAVFDRSWYRRPLAERVAGRASSEETRLALRDIADTEQMLAEDGYLIVKLFLHISQDQQRRRIKFREKRDPDAKLTRAWTQNRRYDDYLLAAEEALARTGPAWAPWTVVDASNAPHAWLQTAEAVAAAIAEGLRRRGIDPDRLSEQPADCLCET